MPTTARWMPRCSIFAMSRGSADSLEDVPTISRYSRARYFIRLKMLIPEQIGLLVFMIIASKGAAGVTGAGLATLAGGLQAYRPDLVNGVGVIVGIDRFMSEGRALTNFTGNAVATILIGTWVKEIDSARAKAVLRGEIPFDETTMQGDDHDGMSDSKDAVGTQGLEEAAVAEAAAKEERARERADALSR